MAQHNNNFSFDFMCNICAIKQNLWDKKQHDPKLTFCDYIGNM